MEQENPVGDVGHFDALNLPDGFHYFIGRSDDMFVSSGENIYPADVERMLERHPDVAQAAVVPIDDEVIKSQQIVADRFARLGLIPKPINVSDIVWKWTPGS